MTRRDLKCQCDKAGPPRIVALKLNYKVLFCVYVLTRNNGFFGSASFVEDHSECSVIQGILLFIVFQTVSPYTAL